MEKKKVNDADVISDATIVDEDNVNQKNLKNSSLFQPTAKQQHSC